MSTPLPQEPIAIVGSGRVARALGRALAERGARIVAIASPTTGHAEAAASFIGPAARAVAAVDIPGLASRVIIAVTDRHIADAARSLARPEIRDVIVVHTSGATDTAPLQVLREMGAACGVMHPLQTLGDPGAPSIFAGVPFAVLGDPPAASWAGAIVEGLGGWPLHPREADLPSYHAAAVLAGNSMWAVIEAAVTLMGDAGIDPATARKAVASLARTSLEHALGEGGAKRLTGPVARGDLGTLRQHIAALEQAPPHVRALYQSISLVLAEIGRANGLSDDDLRALKVLLTG